MRRDHDAAAGRVRLRAVCCQNFEEKSVGNKSVENVLILLRIRFKNAASAMTFVQAMGPILGVLFGKALLRVYKTKLI